MSTVAELFGLAVHHHQSGNLAQAEPLYRQIIQADPAHADAHHLLGMLAMQVGHPQSAIGLIRRAIELNPASPVFHEHLGLLFMGLRKFAEAGDCFREVTRLTPGVTEAHNNLAQALLGQGELAEAAGCFQQVLRIDPGHTDALANLGTVLVSQGKFAEGSACFQKILDAAPGHALALWNRSCLRLMHGDFVGGWHDHEQRWARPRIAPRSFKQPRWDGSPLESKTILLYAEGGLGDTIHFVRYARQVKEGGGIVVLECQAPLLRVLAGVAGVDHLLPQGAALPPFDVQIPLMSLPGIFATTLANIPGEVPYLRPEPALVELWREKIALISGDTAVALGSRFNIGIVWQGSQAKGDDRFRSAPLTQFAPLAAVPGVNLISLQVGHGREQLAQAPFPIRDLGNQFDPSSLHDLAGALPNLDLVVTVDTAVAHLAGALALPVWVGLPHVPDWRWLLGRADSPWYPTMRLFRQSKLGTWDEVFEAMAAELGTPTTR